MQGGRV
ncbi:rCG31094, partial [Rattus norvegicus]